MIFRSVQNVKKKFPLYQYLSYIVVGKYAELHAYYLVCQCYAVLYSYTVIQFFTVTFLTFL